MELTLKELVPALQISVGPVILISGVGLFLLSLTNRFGRVADRVRQLAQTIKLPAAQREQITPQLDVLYKRARLLRLAIALSAWCMLGVSALIAALFAGTLFALDLATVAAVLFIASLCCLAGSLLVFVHEVTLSLKALEVELDSTGS